MKKMIIMLLLSFFMLDTYAATAHLQQDTSRRKKNDPDAKTQQTRHDEKGFALSSPGYDDPPYTHQKKSINLSKIKSAMLPPEILIPGGSTF